MSHWLVFDSHTRELLADIIGKKVPQFEDSIQLGVDEDGNPKLYRVTQILRRFDVYDGTQTFVEMNTVVMVTPASTSRRVYLLELLKDTVDKLLGKKRR